VRAAVDKQLEVQTGTIGQAIADIAGLDRHGRRSRSDMQVGCPSEAVQYLFGEAGGKPLLVAFRRKVLEGQHCNRFRVRGKRGRGRYAAGSLRPEHEDGGYRDDQ